MWEDNQVLVHGDDHSQQSAVRPRASVVIAIDLKRMTRADRVFDCSGRKSPRRAAALFPGGRPEKNARATVSRHRTFSVGVLPATSPTAAAHSASITARLALPDGHHSVANRCDRTHGERFSNADGWWKKRKIILHTP